MPELWPDYIAGREKLHPFYSGTPHSLFEMQPQAWEPDPVFRSSLEQYQARLGLERTIPREASVIITGQQPGIFTGPAYTIYKAITVLHLARQLEKQSGKQCVPVYWIGADDHDLAEVGAVQLLTKQDISLPLVFQPETAVGRSMFNVSLSDQILVLIDQAAEAAAGSELSREVREFLYGQAEKADSLADWFARIMARMFRDTPLLLFSSDLPEARRMAIPILERELEEPLETTRLVNSAAARLEAQGYTAQLTKNDNECSFFVEMEGRRCKVLFESGRFVLPEIKEEKSLDELQALLSAHPERFTPNVALRCIIQQRLFNPSAYVGGPGEIAYWAQFKQVFERYQYPMPVVYPRVRATLTTAKLRKVQSKLNLTLDDLAQSEEQVLEQALQSAVQHPALALIQQRRPVMVEQARELLAALQAQHLKNPVVLTLAEGLAGQVEGNFDRIERALRRSDQTQLDTVRKQVGRLCTVLAPARRPQERVYTIFSFLFAHGWELIPRLIKELDPENFEMQELEL